MIKNVINLLAFSTLMLQIFLSLLLVKKVRKIFTPYSIHLSLIISLTATFGSLFLSEIAKFSPCSLCWYQRIFMYPQPIILGLALYKKDKKVAPYLILLNFFGAIIALYHYFLQRFPSNPTLICSVNSVCAKNVTFYFGYISIPLMAATTFIANIIFLKIKK